jgi:hypothetical protein
MSEEPLSPVYGPGEAPGLVQETPGLTQVERITNTFVAPSKTFIDIRDKSRSWWAPYLLSKLFAYLFFALVTAKVGWHQVAENVISSDAKAQERLAQAPPGAREQAVHIAALFTEVSVWGTAALALLAPLIASLVLWGSINFLFGGKSKFSEVFCVWMYAWLPGIFKMILGSIMVFLNAPDSFNIKNFAPTNIGAFLPADTNKFLMVIATKLDITDLWGLALLSIGLATVARVKRSSGYIVVFGWWAILLLVALAGAAFQG